MKNENKNTWFGVVVIVAVLAVVLGILCAIAERSIFANWDKRVRCEIKGCNAVHEYRVQFADGVHPLCHKHYAYGMVLRTGTIKDMNLLWIPTKWIEDEK